MLKTPWSSSVKGLASLFFTTARVVTVVMAAGLALAETFVMLSWAWTFAGAASPSARVRAVMHLGGDLGQFGHWVLFSLLG